jgi:hypothetical protein
VVIAYNLYLMSTYSMSHAKSFYSAIARRPFSDMEPFVAWRGWFTKGIRLKLPRLHSCMMHLFSFPSLSKTFSMRMPNGKPELGSSWMV